MLKTSIGCLLALASSAAADGDVPTPSSTVNSEPRVAITVSPVHLFVPMAELTTEVRLGDHVGVAVVAGAGGFHEMTTNEKVSLVEAGASVRYYPFGSFRTGLQLGAEALYLHAWTDSSTIEVKARGLSIGPFVGYKWTHRSGLTLEGQGGVTIVAARAKAETGEAAEDKRVGPLLNLNIGYSF